MDEPTETQQEFWSVRKGTTLFLIVLLCSGIVMLSAGILGEMHYRPYWTCINCVEEYDFDGYLVEYCECEPPEYIVQVVLIWCGMAMICIGGGLLLNLVYHWKKTRTYWILEP